MKKNWKKIFLDEIDSTNNYAKELAGKGEASKTVIIAKKQTDGKGRLGRSFCSPESTGLYMSIILRPDYTLETVSLLTSCMAVAAAQAIDRLYNTCIKIKWVNDLYLNGKKICGILTESALNSNGKVDYAIIGIGINVYSIKNTFPKELLEIASSLEDETAIKISIQLLADEILNELEKLLPSLEKAEFMEEYRKRSCIIGYDVILSKQGFETTAKAIGIDNRAGLIVEYPDGSIETVTSGEARIKMNK